MDYEQYEGIAGAEGASYFGVTARRLLGFPLALADAELCNQLD